MVLGLKVYSSINYPWFKKLFFYLFFRVLTELPAEIRFNIEGIDILIRANLINVSREFDPLLVQVGAIMLFNSKFKLY